LLEEEFSMTTESVNWARVNGTLEAFREELRRLSERVAALENDRDTGSPIVSNSRPASIASAPVAEGLSEEIVLVIGAAVAAFLGKKAPIRQIRLLGSAAWSQQGRVTIQASHNR
jgi:methylmalonyl-CoA carboxyltransferase large subunit